MDLSEISVGKPGFVERHRVWTDDQHAAAERVHGDVRQSRLQQVRVSWCDQHGKARGKSVMVEDFLRALRNGVEQIGRAHV